MTFNCWRVIFVFMFSVLKSGRCLRIGAYFGRNKVTPPSVLFATKTKKGILENTWESASEGKTLVIVESPAKARTIQKFVDDSYIIDYCAGHIRDLPTKMSQHPTHKQSVVSKTMSLTTSSLGIDVHDNFKPLYINSPDKADLIKRLKGQAKIASRILLATDEDREGEAISWHLLETIKPTVPYKRAVFHEITKDAILRAFESPRELDMDLVQSQEARRVIDRLAGFTISPVLWRYVAPGLSAGRVQSCGLHSITERERSRWKFVPSSYCSLSALLEANIISPTTTNKHAAPTTISLIAKLQSVNGKRVANDKDYDSATGELKVSDKTSGNSKEKDKLVVLDENITNNLMGWLRGVDSTTNTSANNVTFTVTDIDVRKLTRKPPVPFITSSLQQEASKKHHFSPQRSMALAQMLYEKGYITYMRTDSPMLSTMAHTVSVNMVQERFGNEYVQQASAGKAEKGASKTAPKNAQEAHEAIRPAEHNGQFKMPDELQNITPDEKTLYSLILRRTLASVMSPSNSLTNTYTVTATDGRANVVIEKSSIKSKKGAKATISEVSTAGAATTADSMTFRECVFRSSDTQITFPGFLAAIDMFKTNAYSGITSGNGGKNEPILQIGQTLVLSNRTDFSDNTLSDPEAAASATAAESTDLETSTNTSDSTDNAHVAVNTLFPGLSTTRHHTRPPSRFNEASFIAEMEHLGVGRPSTYSAILKTLVERNYIVVDKSSLIPTIQGMVVDGLLFKHFPTFVDAKFTAEMERQLDLVASGEGDRVEMLNKFYLHNNNPASSPETDATPAAATTTTASTSSASTHTGGGTSLTSLGLLPTIEHKLHNNAIDKTTSHTLELPFLKDLGVIHSYGGGAIFETYAQDNTNPPKLSGMKYTLPMTLQKDLRDITYENMLHLINTEKPIGGECIGYYPENTPGYGNLPIFQKSGKFGKFLQVGEAKNKIKFYSVPKYVEDTVSYTDALLYINLPTVVGEHPTLKANVTVSLKSGEVAVGVEGYSYRAIVPVEEYTVDGYTSLKNLTLETILSLLPESAVLGGNNNILGTYNKEEVVVCQGKFGPYLRCGRVNCALKGVDIANLTLAQAITLIDHKAISATNRYLKKVTKTIPRSSVAISDMWADVEKAVKGKTSKEKTSKTKASETAATPEAAPAVKKAAPSATDAAPKTAREKKSETANNVDVSLSDVKTSSDVAPPKKSVRKVKTKAE